MATVYLAEDLRHDRRVALKVLRPELAAVIGAERFLAEIKLTANLQHPHILPLFDSGEADSFLYYVMPFVEGESSPRPAPPREAAPGGRRRADRARGGRRARLRAPAWRDPSRHQAREHPAARRPRAGGRLRHRPRREQGGEHADDGDGDVARHAAVHEPRAGDGRAGDHGALGRVRAWARCCTRCSLATRRSPGAPRRRSSRGCSPRPRGRSIPQRHTIPPHVEAAVLTALEKLPADRFATAAQFAEALTRPMATRPMASTVAMPAAPGVSGNSRAASRSCHGRTRRRDGGRARPGGHRSSGARRLRLRCPRSDSSTPAATARRSLRTCPWPAAISPDGS